MSPQPLDLSRGVDLAKIKKRSQNKHRWTFSAIFICPDKTVEQMAERRLQAANLIAKDRIEEAEQLTPPPLAMNEESLIRVDGPGCIKCGSHWENPETGMGHGCPVSDEEFQQRVAMSEAVMGQQRSEVMRGLVERARGVASS